MKYQEFKHGAICKRLLKPYFTHANKLFQSLLCRPLNNSHSFLTVTQALHKQICAPTHGRTCLLLLIKIADPVTLIWLLANKSFGDLNSLTLTETHLSISHDYKDDLQELPHHSRNNMHHVQEFERRLLECTALFFAFCAALTASFHIVMLYIM